MPRKPKEYDKEKGARIRFARMTPVNHAGKITLRNMSDLLGKNISTVINWEKGRIISDSDLRAIASITGHDFEWLKTGGGKDPRAGSARELTPERIRQIREACDMSQQMFADTIGVSRGTLVNWERGKTSPKASQAESILEMDMTIGEIAEDVGKPTEAGMGIPEFTFDAEFLERFGEYVKRLPEGEYLQLRDAVDAMLRLMRGEEVKGAVGHAMILAGHVKRFEGE